MTTVCRICGKEMRPAMGYTYGCCDACTRAALDAAERKHDPCGLWKPKRRASKPTCLDCGTKGEREGHQECQYPGRHLTYQGA